MQKIKYFTLLAAASLVFGMTSACQNAENTNVTVTNTTVTDANQTSAKKETAKAEPENTAALSMATPTDAYKSAHSVREKKDIAGLKKVLSKDILEFFTEVGKVDNKTLDDELKTLLDKPQAKTAEVRNEKITGDRAVLEYLDENGKWKDMDFIKEGNDWKLTIPKMDGPATDGPPKKP